MCMVADFVVELALKFSQLLGFLELEQKKTLYWLPSAHQRRLMGNSVGSNSVLLPVSMLTLETISQSLTTL